MGNSASFGGIHINVDRPSYLPGETVTGTVILDLTDAIKANSVYVEITGKEVTQTHWIETNTSKSGEISTHTILWRHHSLMFK